MRSEVEGNLLVNVGIAWDETGAELDIVEVVAVGVCELGFLTSLGELDIPPDSRSRFSRSRSLSLSFAIASTYALTLSATVRMSLLFESVNDRNARSDSHVGEYGNMGLG